jgi:hypothetical protein
MRQYAQLEESCKLATLSDPDEIRITDGALQLSLELPRGGVSLVAIKWPIERPCDR